MYKRVWYLFSNDVVLKKKQLIEERASLLKCLFTWDPSDMQTDISWYMCVCVDAMFCWGCLASLREGLWLYLRTVCIGFVFCYQDRCVPCYWKWNCVTETNGGISEKCVMFNVWNNPRTSPPSSSCFCFVCIPKSEHHRRDDAHQVCSNWSFWYVLVTLLCSVFTEVT